MLLKPDRHLAFADRYDDASRIQTIIEDFDHSNLNFTRTQTLTYDDAGRLESQSASTAGGAINGFDIDNSFVLDGTGNRTSTTTNGGAPSSAAISSNNRLQSDATFTYSYDREGNLTRKETTSTLDNSKTDYTWDHRNRLVRVEQFNAAGVKTKQIDNVYNNDDLLVRRTESVSGANTEHYVYDGDHVSMVIDNDGDTKHRYVYAPGIDELLVDEVFNAAGQAERGYWSVTDHAGTVHELIESDADGNGTNTNYKLIEHLDYDVSGKIARAVDATGVNPIALDNLFSSFAYAGRTWDGDAGVYYNRARWYDANTGRFISEDPIGFGGGDANLFRYAYGDPVNFRDPSGLQIDGSFGPENYSHDIAFDFPADLGISTGIQTDFWSGGWTLNVTIGAGPISIGQPNYSAIIAGMQQDALTQRLTTVIDFDSAGFDPSRLSSLSTAERQRLQTQLNTFDFSEQQLQLAIQNGLSGESLAVLRMQVSRARDNLIFDLNSTMHGAAREQIPLTAANERVSVVGAAFEGANRGATVYADALTLGLTDLHADAVRYQEEALRNGDILSQIGYGSAIVSARATQGLAVIATGGAAAGYVGSTAAGQAVLGSQFVATATPYASALFASAATVSAGRNAQNAYNAFQVGNYQGAVEYGGSAAIDAAFASQLFRTSRSANPQATPRPPGTRLVYGDSRRSGGYLAA